MPKEWKIFLQVFLRSNIAEQESIKWKEKQHRKTTPRKNVASLLSFFAVLSLAYLSWNYVRELHPNSARRGLDRLRQC
jgi:hypothetical protein